MRFITLDSRMSVDELKAIMDGSLQSTVSDLDFLETLAAHKCFLIPPWVIRANPSGNLARVARISYDIDGNVDKPRVLVAVAREFRRAKKRASGFGGRLSF